LPPNSPPRSRCVLVVTRTEVITQTMVTIVAPTRPVGTTTTDASGVVTTTSPDPIEVIDYQSAKKILDQKIHNQDENRQKLFSLVWQQCTESMKAKIKAHREYNTIELSLNGIDLLREHTHKYKIPRE
jgi:hypothetical protein